MTDPTPSFPPPPPAEPAHPPEPPTASPEPPHGPPSPSVLTIRPPSAETLLAELVVALSYLTRLDFTLQEPPTRRVIRKSMVWFPAIGALIGLFGASLDWITSHIALPSTITATLAVVGMLWITRAIHEEELSTLVNHYGQARAQAHPLVWLQGERSVRYGTLGVVLVIILKIGILASLNSNVLVFQALIASCAWSRTLMVVAASWLRPVEGDPVADHFQQPPALRMMLAVALGVFVGVAVLGSAASVALGIAAGAGLLVAIVGGYHVRGYNGPLLGTLQHVTDLSVLAVVLAIQ